MEITKRNEVFEVTEDNDKYSLVGTVSQGAQGDLNIDFNVNRLDGSVLGHCYYHVYSDPVCVNFGVSCCPDDRVELMGYAEEIIAFIISNFKTTV